MNALEMMVLAGGFGTRLRAAVSDVPKPFAPVGTLPFLQYQIDSCPARGVALVMHRLATVRHCDVIIELERGRDVACGHEGFLAGSAAFY
jgi:NDP-sugar pyrophosphorylase family protein